MSRARDTADQINRVNSSAADATAITVDRQKMLVLVRIQPTQRKLTVNSGIILLQGEAYPMILIL